MKLFPRMLKKILNSFGFDIIRSLSDRESNLNIHEFLNYEHEHDAKQCISIIKDNTMLSKRRLVTLYQQVVYCETNKIDGDFVECGVWKGGAIGLMALCNMRFSSKRRNLHLYDSFTEICEPDPSVDGERAIQDINRLMGKKNQTEGRLIPLKGIYDNYGGPGTLEDNRDLLEKKIGYPNNKIFYHKGWFQETLPLSHKKINKIAILRLDGDWYSSTKVCLEYLFKKVVKGGVIIIDDYGTYDGCKKAFDEFMEENNFIYFLSSVDRDCRYMIKQ